MIERRTRCSLEQGQRAQINSKVTVSILSLKKTQPIKEKKIEIVVVC